MADVTLKPHMASGIELTRAGPSDTFHDLEVGHESAMHKTLDRRSSCKNELQRLTSLRKAITSGEFWQSLPLLSKIFFISSFICGLLVIVFSIQQMASKTNAELLHISLVMLVTAIFYLWFAWDAIVFENAFELAACGVLGLAVCARIIYFVASPSYHRDGQRHTHGDIAVAVLALALQVIVLIFGYITWGQFGWRTYSKLAADMRVTDVKQQRWSFVLVNCFTTLVKLDIQFVIILCMVGLDVGIQTSAGPVREPKNHPLIISNSIGLIVMLAWSFVAFRAVKHENKNLTWILTIFLPIMYILPVVDIVLGYQGQPTAANAKESLILSAVLVLVTRTAVWAFMHVLQRRFQYFKQQRNQLLGSHKGSATGVIAPQTPHIELAPLMRGAWIGKPSAKTPKKKRFFQLSHDGSTLRWSWNKYIVMYYVEMLEADDSQRTLTLKMALESDLRLRFYDDASYSTWKSGLEALLQLLFSPGGLSMELSDLEHIQEAGHAAAEERRDLVMQLAQQEGRAAPNSSGILQQMGLKVSRRPSTSDPENQGVKAVAERARSGLLPGPPSASPSRGSSRGPSRESSSLHWVPPRQLPGPDLPLDSMPPLQQGSHRHPGAATLPVASVLDALKDDPDNAQPETFEEQQGLQRPSGVPIKLKQLISDCLSPTSSMRAHRHHKLSEADGTDTPSPRRIVPLANGDSQQPQPHASLTTTSQTDSQQLTEQDQQAPHAPGMTPMADGLGPLQGSLQGPGNGPHISSLATVQTAGSSTFDGFSPHHQLSDSASTTQQASSGLRSGSLLRGSSSDAMTQVGSPMRAPLQAPSAAGSQTGVSDGSAGTHASSTSQQQRPSLQGMALQTSVELIPYEELRWGRFLGRGAEGAVYAAWYHETPVAVKRPESKAEVEMNLHSGGHDNIVALRGLSQHEDDLYLVMEYCPRGTLDMMLHHSAATRWDAAKLLSMVRSIARGMLHLHTRKPPMLHRDLKPGNIFVGHGLVMKIGDFGMSRQIIMASNAEGQMGLLRALSSNIIGTAAYCAPEILLAESPVKRNVASAATILKSDVYSFGVTVWQIMERKRPFEGLEPYQVQAQWILGADVKLPPISIPEDCTAPSRKVLQSLGQMVQDCTQFDAERRPSFREVVDALRTIAAGEDGNAAPGSTIAPAF